MNVPRMVSQKCQRQRERPRFSVRLRSCTMVEWMNAVAVSHGRNDAFSTGSHAQ